MPPIKTGEGKEGQDETKPISTLAELLAWTPAKEKAVYDVPSINDDWRSASENRPQVLVCHDMMGGYLEDRFNEGFYSKDDHQEIYRFFHWSLIDTFVYFSHHFVTIPPIGWTVAAHRFGVRCLGTFIIEHWASYLDKDDNQDTKLSGGQLVEAFLADSEQVELVAEKLVALSTHFCFDGWLINMEAPIAAEKLPLVNHFLQVLTVLTSHSTDGRGLVLWYDSVTADTGKLAWQNELNDRNMPFYLSCDGIFLNYCWTEAKLARSKEREIEARRRFDCYVGIDVFGRGCPGGGQWNTAEAVAKANRAHLSLAIFAPGWTFESLPPEVRRLDFALNETKFWLKLSPYLLMFEKRVTKLPLRTSFCQGFGYRHWQDGVEISPNVWFDLRQQQLQPSLPCLTQQEIEVCHQEASKKSLPCQIIFDQPAWSGGCCLKVSIQLKGTTHFSLIRTAINASVGDILKLTLVYRFDDPTTTSCFQLVPIIVYSGRGRQGRMVGDESDIQQVADLWTVGKFDFRIEEKEEAEVIELTEIGLGFKGEQLSKEGEVTVLVGLLNLEKV